MNPQAPQDPFTRWEIVYYSAKTTSAFFKSFDFEGNASESGENAGVTDILLDEMPYLDGEISPWICSPDSAGKVQIPTFEAKIKNFGSNTLHSCNLIAAVKFCGTSCILGQKTSLTTFPNLNLPPDSSVWVTFEGFLVPYVNLNKPVELCVATTIPNQKIDSDRTNDMLCEDFLINSNENIPFETEIKIFPNPVADKLFFEGLNERAQNAYFSVFNNVGKEMIHAQLDSDNSLNVSDLPPGVYFIQLENKPKSLLKFVKT